MLSTTCQLSTFVLKTLTIAKSTTDEVVAGLLSVAPLFEVKPKFEVLGRGPQKMEII